MLEKQSFNLHRLLDKFVKHGNGGQPIIDFTYGTGALWKDDNELGCSISDYKVTKCDREGDPNVVNIRDLNTDDYHDLGIHKGAIVDPPYLIGRSAFDYKAKVTNDGSLVPMQMQGKRSWGTKGVKRYVANRTVEDFARRIRALNVKATQVLMPGGFLFIKVMDVRHQKKLIPHHITVVNELTNFLLEGYTIYHRSGATTWTHGQIQILHGFWLIFTLKGAPLS